MKSMLNDILDLSARIAQAGELNVYLRKREFAGRRRWRRRLKQWA